MTVARLIYVVVELLVRIIDAFQRSAIYQQGRREALGEMDAEQRKRVEQAEAARADTDAYASGELHDPRQRD